MFILRYKKIFISISTALVLSSIILLLVFGMNVGIDFRGGAMTEVSYSGVRPAQADLVPVLDGLGLGSVLLQPIGENGYMLKTRDLNDTEHAQVLNTLSLDGKHALTELGFNSIGPAVGKELARKAVLSIVLVAIAIIFFIAYSFRQVSHPVSSWKYGIIAIITLLHDVLIPTGIFVLLSKFRGVELDTLFVVAALTILGLSLSDTIVIFDRIRENLRNPDLAKVPFRDIVGRSLDQTYARSIATGVSVLLVLVVLIFWGPETTKYFALMLGAGMFFGTYSSIFLASPLLVLVEEYQSKK